MNIIKKNYVFHGLLMCAVVLFCLGYMEITGLNESFEKSPTVSILLMVTPVVIWYLGIYARRKAQGGTITFRQGFAEGFKISLIFGIISPFIFLAYYLFVNPEIVTSVKLVYRMVEETNTTVIVTDMILQFISAIIFGSIISALWAAILRKI